MRSLGLSRRIRALPSFGEADRDRRASCSYYTKSARPPEAFRADIIGLKLRRRLRSSPARNLRTLLLIRLVFDVRLVTHLAHELAELLVGLAGANRVAGNVALALHRHVLRAALFDQDQVPAE